MAESYLFRNKNNQLAGKVIIYRKNLKIKKIRKLYPNSNIIAIDYDPGASSTNQSNRIKLMLTVAKENNKKRTKK